MKSLLSGEKILKLQRECQGNIFHFARRIEVEVAREFAARGHTVWDLEKHADNVEAGLE